jgi:hypothetical protein
MIGKKLSVVLPKSAKLQYNTKMKITDVNGNLRDCISIVPDPAFPGFMKIEYESKNRPGYTHSEWYPIIDFLKNNPKLLKLVKGAKQSFSEDLGVVTRAGKEFIQDISKNWLKDIFVGTPVWISRGKGEGEQRKVIKNNKNKLYLDKPWLIIPDKSSQYVVSFNIRQDIKPAGNTLPGIETKNVVGNIIKKAKKSLVN